MISKIQNVTVFLEGAKVTRCVDVDVKAGKNSIIIDNLSTNISEESLVVHVENGLVISSVKYSINNLVAPKNTDEISDLVKQSKDLKSQIKALENEKKSYNLQQTMLTANSDMRARKDFSLEELKNFNEFYFEKILEIENKLCTLKKQIQDKNNSLKRIKLAISSLDIENNPTGMLSLTLISDLDKSCTITFSYVDCHASWTPFYDLRIKDSSLPILLQAKAYINQYTGEDWIDIPITLSSGNPTISNTCPKLSPWYLDEVKIHKASSKRFSKKMVMSEMSEDCMEAMSPDVNEQLLDVPNFLSAARLNENMTSIEFVLPDIYTIPNSDENVTVDVMSYNIDAKYTYYSIRKLDKDVFLMALIENWEKLNILCGNANIFLEDSYVGTTYIDPRKADNKMELSLGHDNSVIVTREKGKDMNSKTLFGNSRKVSRQWTLTVKNTKQSDIDIVLLDQIPVSINKDIIVEVNELSDGKLDSEKGEIRYELHIASNQTVKKQIKYTVTYPKNMDIILE